MKVGSNTVTRNVWSPVYIDGLVLRDRDTDGNGTLDERLYLLQDANWNTTALVNTTGTIQERYTYTPFGQVTFRDGSGSTLSSSAKDWVFLHQGGEKIAAGNFEFRNRVYSPSLGRWLSNDPLGFDAGDQNWYRGVGNNPGNRLDPWGLFFFINKPKPSSGHQTPNLGGFSYGGNGGIAGNYLTPIGRPLSNLNQGLYSGGGPGELSSGSSASGPASQGPNSDLFNFLAITGIEIGIGFIPVVGTIKDWQEVLTGWDVINQEPITGWAYGATVIGATLPGVSSGTLRGGSKVAKRVAGAADEVAPIGVGRLRDPKTGRFIPDPANLPSPNVMTNTQRRAYWKQRAQDPNSPLTAAQRAEIEARGWRGPQRLNEFGELETMELSHEPIPLRDGGKDVVPRWPADHAAIDPHRQLK